MKRCDELEGFLKAPVGSYVVGKTWLVWCALPNLAGALAWGHHAESDAKALVAALKMTQALATPYDFITDFSRVATVDLAALELILDDVREQRDRYFATTRTSVLVRPSGFASALATGAFRLYAAATNWQTRGTQEQSSSPAVPGTWQRAWRIVETTDESFAALDRKDSDATRAALRVILDAEAGVDLEIETLRGLLLKTPRLTLAQAAKQLRLSERSLQRKLEEAGTSFRTLSTESKLQEAKRLLQEGNEKLSAIARQVGLRSAEQLNKLFRTRLGTTPSTLRKRTQGDE